MAVIGLIGIGVMGRNLARNLARRGFSVAVYDLNPQRAAELLNLYPSPRIQPATSLEEFVGLLEKPRITWLMVNAGRPVDAVLGQLKPLLEAGDIIIDGGNSYYRDTERRAAELSLDGIDWVGMGISGGAAGALHGPSLMPGGARQAYDRLAPILNPVAARADDGQPCVAYLGAGAAGHYVKTVHNGIEYALMQAIAEAYDLLQRAAGLDTAALAQIFSEWNEGELGSFLMEITARILNVNDPADGVPLVERVLDRAAQKGTGMWTARSAVELGVPLGTILAAVDARSLSSRKAQRLEAAARLQGPTRACSVDTQEVIQAVRTALYATLVVAYAQGFDLLREANLESGYGYALSEVARIWRAGCIIRSKLLEDIYAAARREPDFTHLLQMEPFCSALSQQQTLWRKAILLGVESGTPLPVMSAALAGYDGLRSARLPANLIQAQRDLFGSHTFERVDQPGSFHSDWK